MNKRVTGLERDHATVVAQVQSAKSEFLEALQHLRSKKEEKMSLKQSYEEERRQKKKDEQLERQFKFGRSMHKKSPFFPTISSKGQFKDVKTLDSEEAYLDSRKRYTLLFPDRCFEKKKKWLNTKHHGKVFSKAEGQENDRYDESMMKLMRQRGGSVSTISGKVTIGWANQSKMSS